MDNIITKKQARDEAWRRGALHLFKMDTAQKKFYEKIYGSEEKVIVILCSRRIGKSWGALCMAIQQCLIKPNSIVKFLAPTKLMLKENIEPIMTQILEDCPPEIRPEYIKSRTAYRFQNGSMIQMAGTDSGNAEKLRGGFAHLCIVDEAQSCNDLTNAVQSILIPTTTNTKGKIVILGTAPEDTEHDFLKFIERADAKNSLIRMTIYENPRIRPDEIQGIINAYPGGAEDPNFQREYLCAIIKNEKYSAIPEFTEELEKEIVREWKRPVHFDYYEGMDLGGKDLTVVLFAYYDFRNATIVVEDELVMNFQEKHNNIATLVENIKKKEAEHFSDPIVHEVKKPTMRVSDIDYIALKEIRQHSHNTIDFQIAKKDEKASAINNLRILLNNKRIIINPRCQTLIKHLRHVKWSKSNRNVFERSADNAHYDAVDALIYLTRVISLGKNPYPANYGLNADDLVVLKDNNKSELEDTKEVFRKLFNIGKKYGR